jgi:hypothetical protein
MISGRRWHQPHAHLGDDAVAPLREQTVDPRTIAQLQQLPAAALGHRTHAEAHDLAVCKHHFKAALHEEMVGIGRIAGLAHLKRGDDAVVDVARQVHRQRQLLLLDILCQLPEGDPGLDQAIGVVSADFEDPVHLLQVNDDGARMRHAPQRTIAVADNLQRPACSGRSGQHLGQLFARRRHDGQRLTVGCPEPRERLAVFRNCARAQRFLDRCQCSLLLCAVDCHACSLNPNPSNCCAGQRVGASTTG